MATLLLHVNITWLLFTFAKCCLKKMVFTVCHYCDNYCAIMSFNCSQETFRHDEMNDWVFELYPVAFYCTQVWNKTILFATFDFDFNRFLSIVYVKPYEVNQIKGSIHSMNIFIFFACVSCCTNDHKLNTCTYCFIQMTYCFCNDVQILVSMPWRMFWRCV